MRRALLVALTMTAFASNSLLNRMAVDGGYADPGGFAVLRVLAGAIMLVLLVRAQGRAMSFLTRQRWVGAGMLALYMVGFSAAYRSLDAGLGALILFGVVQITIFMIAAAQGAGPSARQIVGAAIAFGGLVVVLDPGQAPATALTGAAFMIAAGIGWGIYTLAGRGEPDALAATAANFCLALPLTLAAPLLAGAAVQITWTGAALAVVSGALTSGLGYALWYALLPGLAAPVAAILQLSVPVIAVIGGVLLLGETAGFRLLAGAVLVLGGIGLSLRRPKA